MPEFLELLETVQAEQASVQQLFGDAGAAVRGRGSNYPKRLAEAARLIADVYTGRRPMYLLREAMTTSDFPLLFGDILDRQLLANYREWPQVWPLYCKRGTVRDFRTVSRHYIDGAEDTLDGVDEQAEYPMAGLSEGRYQYAVGKYGRKVPFSWETLINDDLDAFRDLPARLARAARRSEEKFATQLHVDANGPHASLYTVGNANIVTGNPALSIAGLQTAMGVLGAMVDADGEPIVVDAVVLEVPPALEITAQNILNAISISVEVNAAAGTAQQNIVAQNWMRGRVTLAVNPYIPLVATIADGNTCWFLHAAPNAGRPAFEMGFLRGHEEPEIFMKQPNATRVGGGMNATDGDFDTDSIEYKIRHVFGGSRMSPKATVASEGDNT